MTGVHDEEPRAGSTGPEGTAPKAPPPGLSLRASPPPVTRLRRSVVQGLVLGGVVLISGSLTWAFVVQPELRDSARARAAEARETEARGVVRPAEAVTDQPASYDRLPPPRGGPIEAPAEATVTANAAGPLRHAPDRAAATDRGPSPRELAIRSALFFESGGDVQARPATEQRGAEPQLASSRSDLGSIYNDHTLTPPLSPYELKAGAIVSAALLTGIDTERPGPVVATVTQNVFDTVSGRHLVLPQGTRLIGRHEGDSAYGDRRAVLVWDRMILPNGKSLLLGGEPGVDAQGAVGVRGQVDRRLFPLLVGTLFAGAITTLGQAARSGDGGSGGWLGDVGDAAAVEGAQVGGRLIDRELQVRSTIRLRPGAPVRVMITRDLILEPYQP